jgi:hypothetical protein
MELIISGLAPDSGLFSLTNGQETKYHFTINNSPLPSNVINDVAIIISQAKFLLLLQVGLFQGTATTANDDLSKVYVYPILTTRIYGNC